VTGDRRAELVDAGVRLLATVRFEDVLAAVDTRAIAEAADVTTGSFFHHFRTRERFARAVGDRFAELWSARVERLTTVMVVSNPEGVRGVRPAASTEWAALVETGPLADLQHLLWSVRRQPVVAGSATTAGEVVRAAYEDLLASSLPSIERNLRTMGREPLPPFDARDLSVITTAIAEGLQMRAAVDPEVVRPTLYADTMAAVLLAMTQPMVDRNEHGVRDDLDRLMARVGERSDAETVTGGRPEAWRHIAERAADLFVDRSPDDVRIAEVATAAGVAPSTVTHLFGGVRAVAAASWMRHLPELEAIAAPPSGPDEDPTRRIEAVLLRYVELLRSNRGAAEAMIGEVLRSVHPGAEVRRDLRRLVPVPALLEPHIEELRRRGRLRRRVEIARLARSLVHLVTMQAALFPDDSPARILDETMTMSFDGALVEPSDA
jgi:AcrR family transcriptional regulator